MQGRAVPEVARGRGVAVWRQLAAKLEQEIQTRPFLPDTRLPGEVELACRFGVNRHTVRRAIGALAERGLVRVEHGRGCFVQDIHIDYPLGTRTRFSANLIASDRVPGRRVLGIEQTTAGPETARHLAIDAGAAVFRVRTLGIADDVPVVVGCHDFPALRLPRLPECLAAETSFTVLFQQHGIEAYTRRSTRITARLPSAEEAATLKQPAQLPVLVTEAVDVDPAGMPLSFGTACFAAGRVQLTVES